MKKGDKEIAIEKMLQTTFQMREDFERRQQIAHEKLWQEISYPESLGDALSKQTKHDLDEIRKNYDFGGISNLKKADLVNELVRLLVVNYPNAVQIWSGDIYNIVKEAVDNGGFINVKEADMRMTRAMINYGILFPGKVNGEKVLYIPTELFEQFNKVRKGNIDRKIAQNDQWIKLVYGMLHYYGVLPYLTTMDMIRNLIHRDLMPSDIMPILDLEIDFRGQIKHGSGGYQQADIRDGKAILIEQESRPHLSYCHFTKQQLLQASKYGYIEETIAILKFRNFLNKYYTIPKGEVDEIIRDIVRTINSNLRPTAAFDYLQTRLEFENIEVLQELTQIVMEIHNTTHQWVLKGHMPTGVSRIKEQPSKQTQAAPFVLGRATGVNQSSKVIDINSRKKVDKVGRNDQCPCGSGKKHKKCCGK